MRQLPLRHGLQGLVMGRPGLQSHDGLHGQNPLLLHTDGWSKLGGGYHTRHAGRSSFSKKCLRRETVVAVSLLHSIQADLIQPQLP